MPSQIPSKFQKFVLSEKEQKQSEVLPPLALYRMHNLRTDLAEAKLNLKYDPQDPISWAQNEAFLSGQIHLLNTIIGD